MVSGLLSFHNVFPPSGQTHCTPRFSGAQDHHYLLNFLQSVAERYRQDGRAGDLIVDLLNLKVPKLFAVDRGGEKDEEVRRKFSHFLLGYILKCPLKHTILEKMNDILVREAKLVYRRLNYLGTKSITSHNQKKFFSPP